MRIGYLVSRFPAVTETFVLREINAVAALEGLDVSLMSLFPARDEVVHHAAQPWVLAQRRAGVGGSGRALLYWLARKPNTLIAVLRAVAGAHLGSPKRLWRSLATVAAACQHARALEREPVDHIHAHFASYPALAAWVCSRLVGTPFSFTAHAHDIFVDRAMLTGKIAAANLVVTISEFNRRFLGDIATGHHTPIHVVHCGIELDRYQYRDRSLEAETPIRAVCVASLQGHKGHEVLLRALARGGERLRALTVDVVGDGPLRLQLEGLASELGLDGRVAFRGAVSERDVEKILEEADCFVLPSTKDLHRMDGLPVALIEAAASGLPMVASRLSGIPELVRDGETGLLAEPGDPDSLAETLARLVADREGAKTRARRARTLVEEEFDIRRSAMTLEALFRGSATGDLLANSIRSDASAR